MFIRPIVIVRKFNKRIFWAIPFTSSIKEDSRYYFRYDFGGKFSAAILSQLRLIDQKRLVRKLDVMKEKAFVAMKQRLDDVLMIKKRLPPLSESLGGRSRL